MSRAGEEPHRPGRAVGKPDLRLGVIGGGAWGTALAVHLGARGRQVRLWVRERQVVEEIRGSRENRSFLPGVKFPAGVEAHDSFDAVLEGAELALLVVPAQYARGVYRRMAPHLAREVPIVVAAKGIEVDTLELPLTVAREELGSARPGAVMSGPSFAAELAGGRPTAIVVASSEPALARSLQRALSSPLLRLYTNPDPLGVQLAAAVKNVIAIAAGVVDGMGAGSNAKAAVITRGLAEMTRLGRRMGGKPATFSGLAGLGDLVLTCTGALSRNREVGLRLGRGERLEDILRSSRGVAEGVPTARSALALARRHAVEMPIVEEVVRLLFEDGSPSEAVRRLMGRPLRAEEEPKREAEA